LNRFTYRCRNWQKIIQQVITSAAIKYLMCMQNLLEARSADNLKGDVMGDVFDHPICASFGTV